MLGGPTPLWASTVKPRLHVPRLSGFLVYLGLFPRVQFCHEYDQDTWPNSIKTTALKSAVKSEFVLLSKSESSAQLMKNNRMCSDWLRVAFHHSNAVGQFANNLLG